MEHEMIEKEVARKSVLIYLPISIGVALFGGGLVLTIVRALGRASTAEIQRSDVLVPDPARMPTADSSAMTSSFARCRPVSRDRSSLVYAPSMSDWPLNPPS